MHIVENLPLLLLGAIFSLALLGAGLAVLHARRRRTKPLSQRSSQALRDLAQDIATGGLDCDRVEQELVGLAKALHVNAGKLRPDDVVAEILGTSLLAGDDLLDIEVRLQKSFPDIVQRRLTVREVIAHLAQ